MRLPALNIGGRRFQRVCYYSIDQVPAYANIMGSSQEATDCAFTKAKKDISQRPNPLPGLHQAIQLPQELLHTRSS